MCKRIVMLISIVLALLLTSSVQAAPIPFSVDTSVEAVVGNDGVARPDKVISSYYLHVENDGTRVTLISFDISGLKRDDQMFANVSLSNMGFLVKGDGNVDVYGVVEDLDNIGTDLTWNSAPGVVEGILGSPVTLDKEDLTDMLLSFSAPARDVRESTETSEALADFLNSDTDGTVTLLLAPRKIGTQVQMKSSRLDDGGTVLSGEITTGLDVVVVIQTMDYDGDGVQDDQDLIDFLESEAHNVEVKQDILAIDVNMVEELNAADVILFSRSTSSGDYDDGDEPTLWNSISAPLVQMSAYLVRSSRWLWIDSSSVANLEAPLVMPAAGTSLFDGVKLDPNTNSVAVIDPSIGKTDPNDPNLIGLTSFIDAGSMGNGRIQATTADGAYVWIASWLPGVEFYDGAGQYAGGKRMMLLCGTQEPPRQGEFNLNDNGKLVLRNAIIYLAKDAVKADAVHSYTFEDGTPDDVIGDANGVLVGGAEIIDGSMVTTAQDQWMEMPGDVIDINSYEEVTIEAFYTPTAGGNTSWSMLAYFGDSVDGLGSNGFFITSARGDDVSRAAISVGDIATPWASESGANGPEYDDGLAHYMASTIDAADITLYIDGKLIASTPLSETNMLSGVSNNLAYLAKGGYTGDPEWIGAIDEFNIYDTALSEDQIEDNYMAGPE